MKNFLKQPYNEKQDVCARCFKFKPNCNFCDPRGILRKYSQLRPKDIEDKDKLL